MREIINNAIYFVGLAVALIGIIPVLQLGEAARTLGSVNLVACGALIVGVAAFLKETR